MFFCVCTDSSEIPSLWEMQSSLLNDSSEDVLVPLCQSLLISALEDPGCEGPNVSIIFFCRVLFSRHLWAAHGISLRVVFCTDSYCMGGYLELVNISQFQCYSFMLLWVCLSLVKCYCP